MALLLARVALQRYLPLAAAGTLQYPKGSMAEVYLPSLLQLLITSDYLLLLHTLHRAPLIVTRYLLALGGYSSTKTKQGAKVQPVHTQKLRCLLGIGRGTNEVWAACQPVRDHYVGGLVGQSCLSRRNLHCWTHLRYRQMVGNCSYNHDCHSQ